MNFLEKYGFTPDEIEQFVSSTPKSLAQDIEKHPKLISKNIEYLRDLGVNNYREIFQKYYDMFLMDNSNFIEVFAKYDREDLVDKLAKNIDKVEFL